MTATKLKTAVTQQRAALGEFAAQIAGVRKDIAAHKVEAEDIEQRFAPKSVVLQALDSWLEQQVQQGKRYAPVGDMLRGRAHAEFSPATGVGLVLAACGDSVRRLLAQRIDEVFAGTEGLSNAEKEDALSKLDGEIAALEIEEESMIRVGEAQGLLTPRREDASPMIVLAADEELTA